MKFSLVVQRPSMNKFLLLACATLAICQSQAQAGPTYGYEWLAPGGTATTSDHGNYILVMDQLGSTAPSLTTDTNSLVTPLSLHTTKSFTSSTDTFGSPTHPDSFTLDLVLTDASKPTHQDNHLSPLVFRVDYSMDVNGGTPSLTSFKLTPIGSDAVTLNGNKYTVGVPSFADWVTAPAGADTLPNGSITLHIGVDSNGTDNGPGAGPVSDTPEPTGVVLATLGAVSVAYGWRRRKILQDSESEMPKVNG